MLHRNLLLSFTFLTTAVISTQVFAVVNPPSIVDPGRQGRELSEPPPPVQNNLPSPLPNAVEQGAETPAGLNAFMLNNIELSGETVISGDRLKQAYAEFLGKNITPADLKTIVRRLTQMYRDEGYVLSQAVVPSQDVQGGVLRIVIVEGYISAVNFQGALKEQSNSALLDAYGNKIMADKPLHMETLERYLLLMNDLAGATARSVLTPNGTQPGSYVLAVLTDVKTVDGSASVDNRGSRYFGPEQYSVSATSNGNLGKYERLTLHALTTSPTTELRFGEASMQIPLDDDGTKLLADASLTHTEPGTELLQDLELHGESEFLQLQVQHPFIRSRVENLSGTVGLDYRSSDSDIFHARVNEDRLWVARAGTTYDRVDPWNGSSTVNGQVSEGLNVFNATDEESQERSRSNADATFTKLNADISRTQGLPYNFSFVTSATGQYAFERLLSAEEFSLGGGGFGEAYDPSEISGDDGLAGKLELRWNDVVGLSYFDSYQLFASYDVGSVWTRGVLTGTSNVQSLASFATGFRANFTPWLYGSSEVAFPLTHEVSAEGNEDMRIFFSLVGRLN